MAELSFLLSAASSIITFESFCAMNWYTCRKNERPSSSTNSKRENLQQLFVPPLSSLDIPSSTKYSYMNQLGTQSSPLLASLPQTLRSLPSYLYDP